MRNEDGSYTHKCSECAETFNTGMQLRMHFGHKHKFGSVSGSGE